MDTEKINMEREADILRSKYTDIHHSVNININDIMLIIFFEAYGERTILSIADNTRPPSKPIIGKRLSVPNAKEDIKKYPRI